MAPSTSATLIPLEPRIGTQGWLLVLVYGAGEYIPDHLLPNRTVRENYFERTDDLDIFLSHRHPAMKMRGLSASLCFISCLLRVPTVLAYPL